MNFYPKHLFPFTQELEANYPAIRAEAERQIEARFKPYAYSDVYTAGWTTLDLLYHDNRLDVRNRPRFTVSDCTDPLQLFTVLLGDPTSFESGLLQARLGEETMRELSSYTSPHDCTPSMIDRLVAGMNAVVADAGFFVEHQRRLTLDDRAPRSRERLAKLLAAGRLVQRDGQYALGRVEDDEAREQLRWLHVAVLEEVVYPSFLKKGGLTEFKDVTDACPVTTSIVKKIPGLRSVWFSCLAPGSHILAHTGNDATMLRCHLGLIVPGDAVMAVGSHRVSPNDFKDVDRFLPLLAAGNDSLPARLLRDALPEAERRALEGRSSLSVERTEDPEGTWKLLWAVAEALNTRIEQPGFCLPYRDATPHPASPVFDETFARLQAQGVLTAKGEAAPAALASESGREELHYLNTLFFIERAFPEVLAKSPRVRREFISWEEGRCFVFDDTQYHEVWQRSDRNRVILNVDVDRETYA
ncbi:aspartyl/asparaginyl beta-hydroxylase domain-containing protein [Corallococcus sp. BB11-1]|uniref:aspartyl/asparaginyl beta-hydroxylase domain-containing protein n=1 Tax=Corallococcus sp. BB11-1 TaxID=2996783 RepID=UPI0022720B8C|nr:aspartyl/asparaginyl beta-hydroxylase domain-containing protein [Corallococcus sp. BB11-1]MCY1032301.1 aspartyl/asparaginyl beta-hydroxylase domain-containing protein [Corallococcus sp. BB11-1]